MQSILRGLVVVLLILLPEPAAAAPGAPTVEARLGTITLAPDGPAKTTLLWLRPTGAAGATHHFTLTLDAGAVAGLADVEIGLAAVIFAGTRTSSAGPDGPCRRTTTTTSCTWDDVIYASEGRYALGFATARPKHSARAGDEGAITITARLDNGPETTTTSTLRIGTAVDLAAVDGIEVTARPGATANATPVVRNTGTVTTDGAVMVVDAVPRLPAAAGERAAGQRNNVASIVIEVAGAELPITGPGPLGVGGVGLALIAAGLLAVRRLRRNSVDPPVGGAGD